MNPILLISRPGSLSVAAGRQTISASGMSCIGSEETVGNALNTVVTRVDVDHEGVTVGVVVEDDVTDDYLHTVFKQAGYRPEGGAVQVTLTADRGPDGYWETVSPPRTVRVPSVGVTPSAER